MTITLPRYPAQLSTAQALSPRSEAARLALELERAESLVVRYYEALHRIAQADHLDTRLTLVWAAQEALGDHW